MAFDEEYYTPLLFRSMKKVILAWNENTKNEINSDEIMQRLMHEKLSWEMIANMNTNNKNFSELMHPWIKTNEESIKFLILLQQVLYHLMFLSFY